MNNTFLSRIDDNSIHLTVTSPPYVTTEFKRDQEFDYEGFLCEFGRVCEQVYRATVPGGRFALNVADIVTKYRYEDEDTLTRVPFGSDCLQVAQRTGFRLLERFIWDKGFTRTMGGPILGSYPYPLTLFNNNYFEYIFVLRKPGKRKVTQDIRVASRLTQAEWRKWVQQWWRIESISERVKFHRAVFPLDIPYRLIRMYSYIGDTVLDPYLGTGTTMIAAHLCDRSSVGFELASDCKSMIDSRIKMEINPLLEKTPTYRFITE
jgi:DNA modification methylase